MNLIRWKELDSLDRLMNNFFGEVPAKVVPGKWGTCKADVYMKDDKITADIDLPGVDPENVEVAIDGHYLKIQGSRNEENEVNEKDFYHKEIVRGSFERYIPLPTDQIDEDNIQAVYKKGVLNITIPKKIEEKKKIEIRIEGK